MLTFAEKERICEMEFAKGGRFWHLFTDGSSMEDIFLNEDDMKTGMIALAMGRCIYQEIEIITFELMSNHLHLILRGDRGACLELFGYFKKKLARIFCKQDRCIDWKRFKADILEIPDLKALRNEIIYVNRNAFVADPRFTPFSYPWGGGWAYFSPVINLLVTKSISEIGFEQARRITHSRDFEEFKSLKFIGNTVFIPSFCNIGLGERMFANARSYFMALTRNSEGMSLIAARLKDSIFLTDEELYTVAFKYGKEEFECRSLILLTPEQRIKIAKELYYKYNASHKQIRRILKLDQSIISELFPQK
jgi:REP element-mobilizing transposase RayT